MKIGSLFSGYGGLDIAVESFFHARTVWHAEWEDAPSKVLAHHWPGVPNFRDVTQVDWSAVEPVDIITGGFPCQDVSMAGKRAGMVEGTRSNLWGAMRTAVETIRPRYVVAENVRGLLSATAQSDSDLEQRPGFMGDGSALNLRALGRVLGDLADIGYDAQWYGLRAADIGAPHNRFRVFILATDTRSATIRQHSRRSPSEEAGSNSSNRSGNSDRERITRNRRATTSDSRSAGSQREERWSKRRNVRQGFELGSRRNPFTTDADSDGRRRGRPLTHQPQHPSSQNAQRHDASSTRTPQQTNTTTAWGDYQPAIKRWERAMGRPAPKPTQPTRSDGKHQLSPVFVEWMMGLEQGWVTDVPDVSRANQLKMCGNGVVPQQAYEALRRMKEVA